jgi:hypothetical protein
MRMLQVQALLLAQKHAGVTLMVECLTCNEEVADSNSAFGSKTNIVMKKIELWANFTYPAIKEMVELFEERGYEVNKIWSASTLPILITESKLLYSGYGNIMVSFGLFKKK